MTLPNGAPRAGWSARVLLQIGLAVLLLWIFPRCRAPVSALSWWSAAALVLLVRGLQIFSGEQGRIGRVVGAAAGSAAILGCGALVLHATVGEQDVAFVSLWVVTAVFLLQPRALERGAPLGLFGPAAVWGVATACLLRHPPATSGDLSVWILVLLDAGILLFLVQMERPSLRRGGRGVADERAALRLAGMLSLGLFVGALLIDGMVLRWIPRLDSRAPEAGFLSRRWEPLGMAELAEATADSRVVAAVSVEPWPDPPSLYYLREFAMDEEVDEGEAPYLRRRSPGLTRVTGTPGIDLSHRVVQLPSPPPGRAVQFDVRLFEPRHEWMVQPQALWLQAGQLLEGDEESWARPGGKSEDGYLYAALPERYRGEDFEAGRAVSRPREERRTVSPDELDWLASFGRELGGGEADDLRRVQRIARSLQRGGEWRFPPDWNGSYRDFIDRGGAGLCVHFAQLAAQLCRQGGMQARVAVGYLAREFDPESRCYVIRARNRHAWLEVQFEEHGWLGFEVTPARRRAASVAAGAGAVGSLEPDEGPEQEAPVFDAAQTLGGDRGLWMALAWVVLLGWLLLRPRTGPGSAFAGRSAHRPEHPAAQFLARLERICRRQATRRPWQTPTEFLDELAVRHAALREVLPAVLRHYQRWRFADLDPDKARRAWQEEQLREVSRLLHAAARSPAGSIRGCAPPSAIAGRGRRAVPGESEPGCRS